MCIFIQSSWNGIPAPDSIVRWEFYIGLIIVLGKTYLTKQASLLMKYARTTSNSELSAKLISKAADLKAQADPMPDKNPKAPDVSPSEQPGT